MQAGSHTDRHKCSQTVIYTDRQKYIQAGKLVGKQTNRRVSSHTGRHTGRLANRHANRQAGRQGNGYILI